jgi:WD40 repeat protein
MQKISAHVLCMCFDSSGFNLWTGDDKGGLATFHFDIFTLKLSKARRVANNPGYSLTSVAYKNLSMKESCVLVNAMPNYLLLYKISNSGGSGSSSSGDDQRNACQLAKRVNIKQATTHIRSMFCSKSGNNASFVVCTGSEDGCVCVYDMNNQDSPVVSRLQGHSSGVLDVSFNYDQSLLASADHSGTVIVWQTNSQL